GHGVGAFLSVHEGPQRIAKTGNVPLEPGMILSNEPGYYASGAYGIRIENLVLVEPREIPGGQRPMLGFETLTLAPYDRRLSRPLAVSDGWLIASFYSYILPASPGTHGATSRNALIARQGSSRRLRPCVRTRRSKTSCCFQPMPVSAKRCRPGSRAWHASAG